MDGLLKTLEEMSVKLSEKKIKEDRNPSQSLLVKGIEGVVDKHKKIMLQLQQNDSREDAYSISRR